MVRRMIKGWNGYISINNIPRRGRTSTMFVKEVSGKELLDFHGKSKRGANLIRNSRQEAPSNNSPATPVIQFKRLADLISNSPLEAPSNNSPATPLINVVKRPRLEVSCAPPVHIPRCSQPSSSEGVNEMWTSVFNEISTSGDGDVASVWDNHFPFGDLIDKHFIKEKFSEKVKDLELERVLQTSLTDCIRTSFLHRVMGQKFGYLVKENQAYVGEVAELKNKLSEYEKNLAEMTTLKDELNKLKKVLQESSLEKIQMVERENKLMQENMKLHVKDDAHKVTVDKLKAEIDELKGEISLHYKDGYDDAINEVVRLASGLKR